MIACLGLASCVRPTPSVRGVLPLRPVPGRWGFPGTAALTEHAIAGCLDAFEPFVGRSYEDSIFGFNTLAPTKASWEQHDDRELLCLIGDYDDSLNRFGRQHRALISPAAEAVSSLLAKS